MMESAEILKRQEALTREIASRRDDLVALTQDLIRIPTLNPPGDFYRTSASISPGVWKSPVSTSSCSVPKVRPATASAIRAGM
jgi:acetylornithine deacetylase/succinyl-diaminopimelate desuccinylase-like protein